MFKMDQYKTIIGILENDLISDFSGIVIKPLQMKQGLPQSSQRHGLL